jgi:hypothetical protein
MQRKITSMSAQVTGLISISFPLQFPARINITFLSSAKTMFQYGEKFHIDFFAWCAHSLATNKLSRKNPEIIPITTIKLEKDKSVQLRPKLLILFPGKKKFSTSPS